MTARPLRNGRAAAGDAELLLGVAGGDVESFEELRSRYRRAVERVCRRLGHGEAEDCQQEVFTRVWQKANLFDEARGTAAGWLLTLARNVAFNLQARRLPEPVGYVDEATENGPGVDRLWLDESLARLAEHEREAIELAYFDGLSHAQIACRLDVPLGTVKSWTRRGLHRLASFLGEEA